MAIRRATSTIFFRHQGAEVRNIYLRINPQAIRVQQGGKGTVIDTLGGYFREVLHSQDPQYNGLMLPDLTVECDTGIGYRAELQKLAWVWKHRGDLKADGTPADTYFLDFADEDVIGLSGNWSDSARRQAESVITGTDLGGVKTPKGYGKIARLGKLKPLAKRNLGESRYKPRAYLVELQNFAWDETVNDPYRIRFNFKCKILKDLFWDQDERSLRVQQGATTGSFGQDSLNPAAEISRRRFDYPLNLPAQAAGMKRVLGEFGGTGVDTPPTLPTTIVGEFGGGGEQIVSIGQATTEINAVIAQILRLTGLGENQVAQKIQQLGQSVFAYQHPIYSSGTVAQRDDIVTELARIIQQIPNIPGVPNQTVVEVGDWSAPVIQNLSSAAQAVSLFF